MTQSVAFLDWLPPLSPEGHPSWMCMCQQFLPFDCFVLIRGVGIRGLCNHRTIENLFVPYSFLAILNKAATSVPV